MLPSYTYEPRLRAKATWLRVLHDDVGAEYIEAIEYPLVLHKPRLANPLPTYVAHLVRATLLHSILSKDGWKLSSVTYTQ